MGRETDQEDRRASCLLSRVSRTDKAGGMMPVVAHVAARMTVGKTNIGRLSPNLAGRKADAMDDRFPA